MGWSTPGIDPSGRSTATADIDIQQIEQVTLLLLLWLLPAPAERDKQLVQR